MKDNRQRILDKLAKSNKRKTGVKADLRSVQLSVIDDLKSEVEDIYNGMQDSANDALDGLGKAEQSLGFLQGYIDRAEEAKQMKDELIQQISDLGMDVPKDLEHLDQFIADILLYDDFVTQNDKLWDIKEYVNNVLF